MNASPVFVTAVHVGKIAPLGPQGTPSGFRKTAVDHPVIARTLGLTGDAQADLNVHGGPDKAVYGYPLSRYPAWAAEFPHLADRLVAGSMGENLAVEGIDEDAVHIGDRIRVGGALLQVTQPRLPCFKLGLAFDEPRLIRAMTRNGFCGWYYRVVESGAIGAGDAHSLVERPNPDWSVARFAGIIAARAMGAEVLREIVAMEGLAENWQARALRQLAALRHDAP
ncbi:MOSC domain-containing protein [Glacieibacterium frigidum]|uniref:MOSC domain-containing protein n=1 Tax=Glacieibacterium frigidum TaxID=2593303 RepID=A0A552UIT3_9SPHN|nr:MOSC domain-containing protein [Glacieibacterium frigidum]